MLACAIHFPVCARCVRTVIQIGVSHSLWPCSYSHTHTHARTHARTHTHTRAYTLASFSLFAMILLIMLTGYSVYVRVYCCRPVLRIVCIYVFSGAYQILYHTVPCHAMPCRAVPCRAVPCRAVPCRAVPCHAVPYHTILYCTILYYLILKYCMFESQSVFGLHTMIVTRGHHMDKVCGSYAHQLSAAHACAEYTEMFHMASYKVAFSCIYSHHTHIIVKYVYT